MALIRHFDFKEMNRNSLHDEIDASYSVFEEDGRTIVQINSYGSKARQIRGMASQTMQFDQEGAIELVNILKRAFKL